jgi:hypothetical protein
MQLYATIPSPGKSISYTFQGAKTRLGYIRLVQMSSEGAKVRFINQEIPDGDDGFVWNAISRDTIIFENRGDVDAEFVWFDMGKETKE